MPYTPVTMTGSNDNSAVFRNLYSLVDTYKVTNSTVFTSNLDTPASYPCYVLHPAEPEVSKRDFKGSTYVRDVAITVEFYALQKSGGWSKIDEMLDQMIAGFGTETDNLHNARLEYVRYQVVSVEPYELNGQQVFNKVIVILFKVLL
jgi:hypothetical protein